MIAGPACRIRRSGRTTGKGADGRCRVGLGVALAAITLGAGATVAWACGASLRPEGPVERVFELRIEGGEVADEVRTLRVTEGDRLRLRWTADVPTVIHLHGYDIESEIAPRQMTELDLEAYATGRFPLEVHASSDASGRSHGEAPLVVLEVYPR